MKKKFYFPNHTHEEEFFVSGEWVCMDKAALREFAQMSETPLAEVKRLVHEATEEELANYGKYEA